MALNVRLDDELDDELERTARSAGMTRSEAVREAIREYCARRAIPEASPYERVQDLIGSVKGGPPDLSTNPRKYILERLARKGRGG